MRRARLPSHAEQGLSPGIIAGCLAGGAVLGAGLGGAGLLSWPWAAFTGTAAAGWALVVACALSGRRLTRALAMQKLELEHLADTAPVLLWSLDPDGVPLFANRRLCEWMGASDEDIRDRPREALAARICSKIHPADAGRVHDAIKATITRGEPFAMRYRHQRLDGSYGWVESTMKPLLGPDGAIRRWYGAARDLEQELRRRDELREARLKLAKAGESASLAELAAALSHEINQPLGALLAEVGACRRWLAADPPNVDRALVVAERIADLARSTGEIVRSTAALFRPEPAERRATVIEDIVRDAAGLLAEEIDAQDVALELVLDDARRPVPADPTQVQQVLVNLMRNAVEAMSATPPGRRTLTVTSRLDAGQVRVEVVDTGPGVAEPERLFEAFFTTKPRGMGMGLAISRSVMRDHEGRLWLEATGPQGSRFALTFPARSQTGGDAG